jgi:tRNA-dihydrouridine synthase B
VLEMTHADGIAIGRGAVGNPYLFGNIIDALDGKSYSIPTIEMLINAALRQLRYAVADKGEDVAIPESRKQIALYLKGFRGAARIRTEINMAKKFSEVESALLSAINRDAKE